MKIVRSAKVCLFDAEDNVLVLLRARRGKEVFRSNTLDLPGGELEPSENPQQAAVREMHEETGLHFDIREMWAFMTNIEKSKYGHINIRTLVMARTTEFCPQVILDPREHSSSFWVPAQIGSEVLEHPVQRIGLREAVAQQAQLVLV